MNIKDLVKENFRETESFPKIEKFPIVRLHGDNGVFILVDEGKKKEMGQMFEGFVFYQTSFLTSFSPKVRRFSTEYRNWRTDDVVVFEVNKGSDDVNNVFVGKVPEAREKFPDLRASMNLYSISKSGKFYKFVIKGSSLSGWFDFLSKKEVPLEDYFVRIQPRFVSPEESATGKPYWTCYFEIGDKVDEEFLSNAEIVSKLKSFYETMNKIWELKNKIGIARTTEIVHEEFEKAKLEKINDELNQEYERSLDIVEEF
jgi:hypothetical protein